jgi:glycerol-3-phosphate O-acyltransferase
VPAREGGTTGPTLYLLDVDDVIDEGILRRWVADTDPAADAIVIPHPRSEKAATQIDVLADHLGRGGDVRLAPLRVTWLPPEHDGDRSVRIRDVLRGDPRNPRARRKRRILRAQEDAAERPRAQVVVAESALVSELRADAEAPHAVDAAQFAMFVARQALKALERAEYRISGARYKVPRLVREDLTGSDAFRIRAANLAGDLARPFDEVWNEIEECLDEMVTGYSRLFLDLMARVGTRTTRSGYREGVDYDRVQLERVREVLSKHPAVILPSHKSNLDALVIPMALHENGLPPAHTFAGINMAFWPYGTIFRRAGRIFIRRDIKNDPVYKWVLREYLGYLVEKRFTLEWYIEGTRSRTGKLAPPKLGLLRYIADACREGRTDDVAMIPVSIVYDQLNEIGEYASEAKGATKKPETLAWALKFMRSQHGHFGKIYVRFGEPISLRAAVELDVAGEQPDGEMSDHDIRLQKLAFEVCTRINAVTPITAAALICLVLLSTRGRALTARELHNSLVQILGQVRARDLPLAESAQRLDTEEGVRAMVDSLAANGTIEVFDEGDQPVYRIEPGNNLEAAFYRNTIVHYFVNRAIAEVSLVHAAESGREGERVGSFWDEAYRLRDLLKFDFFFEQRENFRKAVSDELKAAVPDWEQQLAGGVEPGVLLDKLLPLHAFGVLRPFVEAYLVVARALVDVDPTAAVDAKALSKRCLALGGQWLRQDRIRSEEAVSKHLFSTAIQLADHRHLLTPAPDVVARRQELVDQLVDINRHIDVIEERAYDAYGRSLTQVSW